MKHPDTANKSNNKKSSIILTPECQDLWVLSPKQLFLYDEIIIDEQDLNKIQNPQKDTRLAAMKARNAAKLIQWGYLQPANYSSLIDKDERKNIRLMAERLVKSTFPKAEQSFQSSKFYRLSIYTHEKYAEYLEKSILACPSQDNDLFSFINRLNSIENRLRNLKGKENSDGLFEELKWTLERIAAKAIAGMIISQKMNVSKLYDTDEYAPFISNSTVSSVNDMTVFEPERDLSVFTATVAALSKKTLPDVSIADENRLFSSIRDKSEFESVRKALRVLEDVFGEMLNERSDLVRRKLIVEIERIGTELNERMEEANNTIGEQAKWTTMEMLAGQFAGFLAPWIEKAKHASTNEKNNRISETILKENDLAGGVFYLMEVWKRYRLLDDEQYRTLIKKSNNDSIWGQYTRETPWYEQ